MNPMTRTCLLVLLLIIASLVPAEAKRRSVSSAPVNASSSEQDVLRDFGLILDLWRDGRYDDLFDRTATSRQSREQFTRKLASAPRRPACCWEKIQEAHVSLTGDSAVVRARLGFEGNVSGTEFVTRGVKLKKEAGIWMISQSELFALANVSKKRYRYKYLPIQGK